VRVVTENVCVWLVKERRRGDLAGEGGEGSDWEGGPGRGGSHTGILLGVVERTLNLEASRDRVRSIY
jgi:hypothetical protein